MSVPTIYNQISANRNKSWLIMFLFTAFILMVGYVFALALGYQGPGALGIVGFALVFAGLMNLVSYYFSDQVVIALSGAKQIKEGDAQELYHLVENLSIGAGLPMPKVYIIEDDAPNAFATGRDPKHAALAVTTGLLAIMDKLELEGVVAHELSHIKNYDTRLMAVVVVLVGLVAILADIFLRITWFGGRDREENKGSGIIFVAAIILAILAPIVAQLIKLAISRRREFLADASGALLTRYPEGLANALLKIGSYNKPMANASTATAHLYISNPFKDKKAASWFVNLFNTHPPIEERVAALRAM
ncbi:MAG: M48 family metalloprotease [Patescibacteria group bacterium]|nr:M48 family metalloprotease [Patescibacteria group bacterium]